MKILLLILIMSMLSLSAARAQQAAPADMQAIAACLTKAEEAGSLGTNCIGALADACIKKADNDEEKSKACAQRELNVWAALSVRAAKRVQAGGFREISGALAESEKGWIQFRDKLCPVFDKVEPGMMPGNAIYCRMQTTAHRVLLMRRLGDAVNEH